MKNIFNLKLDFFMGFYESYYENSDTEYYAITEEVEDVNSNYPGINMEYDDFVFDYKTRRDDIIETFINVFSNHAPSVVENIEFDHLYSPKYYNFETDEIYANVTLADDWQEQFKKFISENHDWLKESIEEDWTSCDGFVSFMNNNIDEWDYYLFEEMDERYIGCIITYMMRLEHENNSSDEPLRNVLAFEVMEDICDYGYLSYSDSGKEKVEQWNQKHDPAQMSLFSD